MMTYKDQTFCAAECYNVACFRHMMNTSDNDMNLPLAMGNFKETCGKHMQPPKGWWVSLMFALKEASE